MKLIQIKDKEVIDGFITTQKHSQFLQSFEWGEFQAATGKKVIRYGFYEQGKLFFAVTVIKRQLPLGISYLYAPRIGIKYLTPVRLNFIFREIVKICQAENAIFFRFDPRSGLKDLDKKFKIQKTIHVQPEKTLILDLRQTEEELLKAMHQKTRYNIRLAKKKEVRVRLAKEKKDFELFWQVMEQTRARDQFRFHPKSYYQKMLAVDKGFIQLLLAQYQDQVIAGIIIARFGDMSTYMHGASANEHRNVMAPHALQWYAIKLAQTSGLRYYDLNGIDENKWPGVTRFKKGFAGEEVNYPGTFDLVVDKKLYTIYKLLRKIRRNF